uniref:Uncharacterized protein n=1 Tax=Pyricularia oryzae (strain 70-15 / ATCC MYA-4617 / FGSC 8958) TaxID=242507 RepID=Q2KGL5_PYRO7|nr:hypothetical protein MGCH7_ch7g320 [Pyricularia oryzae 70-15]
MIDLSNPIQEALEQSFASSPFLLASKSSKVVRIKDRGNIRERSEQAKVGTDAVTLSITYAWSMGANNPTPVNAPRSQKNH